MNASKIKPTILLSLLLAGAMILAAGCESTGVRERQGAKVGTLTGAALGAIIGHQSGEAGAGAAVGAVTGAIVGSAIGAHSDEQETNRRYERGAVRAQPLRDQHGFSLEDYLGMMTDEEMEILQARADDRPEVPMGVLLTEEEKANLRQRVHSNREIGR